MAKNPNKTTITKKHATASSKAKTEAGSAMKNTDKPGKTVLGSSLSQRSDTSVRAVKRDAENGRFVEKANKHMENAWGKIYAKREKGGKAA